MARRVFLSFSARDKHVAHSVLEQLRKAGAEIVEAESIAEGAEIKLQIADAMRQSDEVIAIVSKDSAQSAWQNFEIGAALALGKKVTPILVGIGVKKSSPVLRSLRAIDLADFQDYILNRFKD
jgi:hypothetical protein